VTGARSAARLAAFGPFRTAARAARFPAPYLIGQAPAALLTISRPSLILLISAFLLVPFSANRPLHF